MNNPAGEGTRTHDLLITNQLLYQLSYASKLSHLVKEQSGSVTHYPPAPKRQ